MMFEYRGADFLGIFRKLLKQHVKSQRVRVDMLDFGVAQMMIAVQYRRIDVQLAQIMEQAGCREIDHLRTFKVRLETQISAD